MCIGTLVQHKHICVVSIGLIRARLEGTRRASGRVLAYLDSHCEATVGWLEPLVATVIQVGIYTCIHVQFVIIILVQEPYSLTGY